MEALRIGGLRYREVALRHPTTYAVMFMAAVPGFEPSEGSHEVAAEAFDAVVRTVARAIEAGVARPGDPLVMGMQLWAAVHGAVALELAGIGFCDDRDALFDELLDSLLRGFAADED
jgi:AcrR family transcriptional regulator